MENWSLQQAEPHLNALLHKAFTEGPQQIEWQDQQTAVVMSREEYLRLTCGSLSFVGFMRSSPLMGVDLDMERDRSGAREIEL
ncbi:MAG: hypothetical protein H7834_04145 [Magnetococcus sp. YQC-9]